MSERVVTTLGGAVGAWMEYTSRNRTTRDVVFGIPRAVVLHDANTREARRVRLGALFSRVFPVNVGTEPLSGMGLINQIRANFDWHSAEAKPGEGLSPLERRITDTLPPRGCLVSEDGVDGIQAALGTLLEDSGEADAEPDYSALTFGVQGGEYAGDEAAGGSA